jgi:hypothetical protein
VLGSVIHAYNPSWGRRIMSLRKPGLHSEILSQKQTKQTIKKPQDFIQDDFMTDNTWVVYNKLLRLWTHSFFFFFFFGGSGCWTQSLLPARFPTTFCFSYYFFKLEVHSMPRLAWTAILLFIHSVRMTHVCHHAQPLVENGVLLTFCLGWS